MKEVEKRKINYVREKVQYTFEISFFTENNVTYVRHHELDLISSSQNQNKKMAKIIALVRLIDLIDIKLASYIKYNIVDKLISKESWEELKNYCDALSKDGFFKYLLLKRDIPIYEEIITKKNENEYIYELSYKERTQDLASLQEKGQSSNYSNLKELFKRNFSYKELSNKLISLAA